MIEKVYRTVCGDIHYWFNERNEDHYTLVFLPGLTADHRLFDRQIEVFEDRCPVIVWDAPGHNRSRPFSLTFELKDKARWLEEILRKEGIENPVLIGQSMGGYVAQMYAELYPERIRGLISIDSAPLQKKYMTNMEIALLKHMTGVYRYYPWESLKKSAVNGVAVSDYGRQLMKEMLLPYADDQPYYAKLAGHGMAMLAKAVEENLPYEIPCPALLICGQQDRAGSCIRYSKNWHRQSGIPLEWIENAGHNSNTDQPDTVNRLIENFLYEHFDKKPIEESEHSYE